MGISGTRPKLFKEYLHMLIQLLQLFYSNLSFREKRRKLNLDLKKYIKTKPNFANILVVKIMIQHWKSITVILKI